MGKAVKTTCVECGRLTVMIRVRVSITGAGIGDDSCWGCEHGLKILGEFLQYVGAPHALLRRVGDPKAKISDEARRAIASAGKAERVLRKAANDGTLPTCGYCGGAGVVPISTSQARHCDECKGTGREGWIHGSL